TLLPTPTPGGSVWQIVFSACPCTPTLSDCTDEYCTENIYVVNNSGTDLRQIVEGKIGARSPSFSPDGRYLAFEDEREDVSITPTPEEQGHGGLVYPRTYLLDIATGEIMPLGAKRFTRCQWFPDGTRLACYVDSNIYVVSLSETGPIQVASIAQGAQLCAFDLSPDGEHIVYVEENPALSEPRDLNIYRVDVNGTGLIQLATLPAVSYCGSVQWSPNGEEVLITASYNSVVSASDLFLIGTEGQVHPIFHSNHHIFISPRWLANGQHIFFVEYDRERDANVFYIVDRNRVVRTLEIGGLGGSILAGDLSPDQTQFVCAARGLYMADLETGYSAPILTDYQVSFDGITTLFGATGGNAR
ncbi:MAG: hypothetical protein N2508_09670, partial [Anaerolineae bacterium]|nr:hypothetical protein [Anaerolineae bacterium]